jgi:hypothetical protein
MRSRKSLWYSDGYLIDRGTNQLDCPRVDSKALVVKFRSFNEMTGSGEEVRK